MTTAYYITHSQNAKPVKIVCTYERAIESVKHEAKVYGVVAFLSRYRYDRNSERWIFAARP